MHSERSISCCVCGYCLDGLVDDGAGGGGAAAGGGGALCPECRTPVADSWRAARDARLILPRPGWARWGFAIAALAEAGLAVVCVVCNVPPNEYFMSPIGITALTQFGVFAALLLWLVSRAAWVVIGGALLPGPLRRRGLGVIVLAWIAMSGAAAALVGEAVRTWGGPNDGELLTILGLGAGVLASLVLLLSMVSLAVAIAPALRAETGRLYVGASGMVPVVTGVTYLGAMLLSMFKIPGYEEHVRSLLCAAVAAASAFSCWAGWRAVPRARSREGRRFVAGGTDERGVSGEGGGDALEVGEVGDDGR